MRDARLCLVYVALGLSFVVVASFERLVANVAASHERGTDRERTLAHGAHADFVRNRRILPGQVPPEIVRLADLTQMVLARTTPLTTSRV